MEKGLNTRYNNDDKKGVGVNAYNLKTLETKAGKW